MESMFESRVAKDGRRELDAEEKDDARELAADEPGVKSGVAKPESMGDWLKLYGVDGVMGEATWLPGPWR